MILLDTSVLIELFRTSNKSKTLFYRLAELETEFAISSLTHYEIFVGSNSSQDDFWNIFFASLKIIPFDINCSMEAVTIYKDLKRKNKMIELADLAIAATAIAENIEMATCNAKHFARVDRLKLITKM